MQTRLLLPNELRERTATTRRCQSGWHAGLLTANLAGFLKAPGWVCALALAFRLVSNAAEDATNPGAAERKSPTGMNEVAVITTSEGELVFEFWPEAAPKTVEAFKALAGQRVYDGTFFHRVKKFYLVEGGDPLTKDPARESEWGTGGLEPRTPPEWSDRKHDYGVISMNRSLTPDEAKDRLRRFENTGGSTNLIAKWKQLASDPKAGWSGSQFFICNARASNPNMGDLNGRFSAFGKLIKGSNVLEKIVETGITRGDKHAKSKPPVRVDVERIRIVPADSLK
jgi:peptidyl-prolyl cis-trans isomerase B (cyclophilin B)